jgi:hypothetical protein
MSAKKSENSKKVINKPPIVYKAIKPKGELVRK